jgi:signal transduction histidine kinase
MDPYALFNNRSKSGHWVALFLALAFASLGFDFAKGTPVAVASEVTSFHQLYGLAPEQASKGMPFRLAGVVLCFDPGWNQLYIYDGAETAWLSPRLFHTNLQTGLNVGITGSTSFSQGSVTLTNLQIRILGNGSIPEASPLKISQLEGEFGQWIEIAGLVRVADTSSGRLSLVIQDKEQTCLVYVMGLPATNDFNYLLGHNVRIRGINASKIVQGRLKSAEVFASGLSEIQTIDRRVENPHAMPVISIDALLNRELAAWTNEPIHLNGLITSYNPGESLVVRDVTGTIRVQVIQTTEAQVDERVDVWGYLSVLPGEASLRGAYFEIQHPLNSLSIQTTASNPPPSGQANGHREITHISEISRMRPDEASQNFPVRFIGIVTYADPDWHNCFVQNPGGAIYVELNQKDVQAGELVEVTGQTSPGGFAPEVINSSLRKLASTNLPAPVKADLEDLANGHLDSHWVQLEGVVRRVTEQWGHETLIITTPKGRFKAVVLKSNDQPLYSNLIDDLVSVQGACTSEMNARGQLTGISLRVPGFEQVSILESVPDDPFAVRTSAISSVAVFDLNRLAGRRVKIHGSVTLVLPGQDFYVQDGTGGIRINCVETNDLHVGDSVNVLGFPSMGDFSPYLEEAIFQCTGPATMPEPQLTTAENILLNGTNDAARIQIEAHLVQGVPRSAHPKLVLQSGSIIFTATLGTEAAGSRISAFPTGSLLRLVGVCSIQAGESHEPESFRLLVSRPQDIVLLSTPPWWTIQHGLMIASGLALGGLVAWGWSSSLRRKVRAQTEVIRRNEQALITISRQAGMSEVATAVLHNVGNVLNSVNISAGLAANELRQSKSGNVSLIAGLMEEHQEDLGHFMTHDPKGRRLPRYLKTLGEHLTMEKRSIVAEMESLIKNIEHINEIVAMQQNYAKVRGVMETVAVTDLIEDAFQINLAALDRHEIQLIREYDPSHAPKITVEKHKVVQILVNLVSNAEYACSESGHPDKRVTVRVTNGDDRVRISLVDNGVGILQENLSRIFNHGFTTRKNGHGFGLHSAALTAQEMGGTLTAQSEGPGRGATFTLELPNSPKEQ